MTLLPELTFQKLRKIVSLSDFAEKIEVVSEDEYRVPSSKDDGKMYDVNCCVGVCSCLAGRGGAFCKHQVLVFEKFGRGFPNLPAITFQERHQLGFLALGDRNHEPGFYIGLKETVTPQQVQIDEKYKT